MTTAVEGNWFLLLDLSGVDQHRGKPLPIESIAGAWTADEDGDLGRFQHNPACWPSDPNSS